MRGSDQKWQEGIGVALTLDRAAIEVDTLPENAVLTVMLSDYAVIREQARYCSETIQEKRRTRESFTPLDSR